MKIIQYLTVTLIVCVCLSISVVSQASAQNLLANPGFEDDTIPSYGVSNIAPTGWTTGNGPGPLGVVKVDGPGGANTGGAQAESDATNIPGDRHYLDTRRRGNSFYQEFTTGSCIGTVRYGGFISSRSGRTGSATMSIIAGTNPQGPVVGQSQQFFTPTGNSRTTPWTPMNGTTTLQANQTYLFHISMSNDTSFDEAYVEFEEDCPALPEGPGCDDCTLCCPPFSASQFERMYNWSQASPTSFNVSMNPTPAIDAQMNGWLSYAQSIRPDIVSVTLGFIVEECPDNVPTQAACQSGFQDFDMDPVSSILDYNFIQWDGTNPAYHWMRNNVPAWIPSNGTFDRPFDINKLYRITAIPLVTLSDGSMKFIGEGWFGDCPFVTKETNFMISPAQLSRRGMQPLSSVKIVPRSEHSTSERYRNDLREFKKMIETSKKQVSSPKTRWTKWLNTDRPSGDGDFQTVRGLSSLNLICEAPVSIECRTVKSKRDWRDTGEVVKCDTTHGHTCRNSEQADRRCEDYEARLECPVE